MSETRSRTRLRRAGDWLLPPRVEYVLKSIACRHIGPAERALVRPNAALRNRHRGQRCFIIATGPSLRQQDLTGLRDEICIGVSNLFVHPHYNTFKPRYHCIAPFHPPITDQGWQQWMDEMDRGLGTETAIFFGLQDRHRNLRGSRFSNRPVHFLKFTGLLPSTVIESGVDLTRALPAPSSVTIMALYVAIYMGCSPIYLLGFDHDHILHINVSTHCYDEHQHALNRAGYNEYFQTDLSDICANYCRLWDQYKALRRLVSKLDYHIFNATPGGMLDVFPRANYGELIRDL